MAKTKRTLKKIWYFIWEDDSWASWFVNIILAFILIKFIVYPGLGLFFQTSHPIVAVVSSSMEHDGNFNEWWDSPAHCQSGLCTQAEFYSVFSIPKSDFQDFKFWNGFNKGDLMVLFGAEPDKIKIGDTIVFNGNRADPIIHRVVDIIEIDGTFYFQTKGDHNPSMLNIEQSIPEDNLIGRAVLRVPYLGYVKIWFVSLIKLFV